jgi:Pro-kumamolisin, activation domain/Bacterial Ig-like domain (group 3)
MNTPWGGVRKLILGLLLLIILNASSSLAQAPGRVLEPIDNSKRITLLGNVHPFARTEFDRGAVADSQPMTRILLLLKRSGEQEAALQTYLEQQQDKSSPNYHAWLTPQQFGAQYGPADADIQAVTQWLSSQGFSIGKVYSGKSIIEFSGTAAQVQSVLGAPIHNYEVNGKAYVANANDPQIPAALAPIITGIVSLNNFPRQSYVRVAGHAKKIPGKPGLQPLFTFPMPLPTGGSETFYGVGPGDFATIYNSKSLVSAGTDGTGETIGIVGETDINVADVQSFRQMFGLSANFTSTNIILNGEDPGITSTDEEGEADLDTQWSGAVAPGATIKYVVSASTPASQGIDLSALYIIEYNLADVMSESYGQCESALGSAGNAFYNSLWEQAAAQGITVVLSAGDGGSAGCDDFNTATVATEGLAVSGLASTPYNVAMGGTDFDDASNASVYWSANNNATTGASALSYIPEIPWNENCAQLGLTGCGSTAPQGSVNILAGSGGASNVYAKPKWQMGVTGMPNDSHRDLPDVSLFASPGFDGSGYIICQSDQNGGACNLNSGEVNFQIVGGTSASAPTFAGIMALVNQYQSAHGGNARQGNANAVLYSLAKKSGASCASKAGEAAGCIFNDVTHGNSSLLTEYPATVGTNSVPCQGGSANCSATVSSTTGVLVEPTSSTTEAWMATAGYDLATGLGSVNINNLATNWGTVNTVQTTTTLTLSPTTGITHGTAENVTVNVTVTPTTGTATGDVSLIATLAGPNGATTQGLDQFTLNSSGQVVNAKTNSLPGGTSYQVYAHYAGDGTNAPSDSAPVTVTVGKETSQTFIAVPTFSGGTETSGNVTSVPFGSTYIIQMVATNSAAVANPTGLPTGACAQVNLLTCPTGKVTLTDNGTLLGNGAGGPGIYALNSAGYTQNLTPNLTGGTHTLVATYSGDNSYNSSSTTTSLTVERSATSISQNLTVPKPTAGVTFYDNVIGVAQAQSGSASTGTVTFFDGTTQLGSPATIAGNPGGSDPSFFAEGSLTIATAGSHTLTAQYSGDANYGPSTNTIPLFVLYPTTCTVTATPSTVNYGSTVTLTGVVDTTVPASNAALKPTAGTEFAIFGGLDGTTSISVIAQPDSNGNWELQASATLAPKGSEQFTIQYLGDSNYGYCTAMSNNVTVNIPDFSLAPTTGLSLVPVAGQPASGQITVTPLSQTPSPVTLSVFPVPAISGYTVAITPQQVNLNGAPVTATLSLTPTVSVPASAIRSQVRRASLFPLNTRGYWLFSAFAGVAALFALGISGRRKRYRTAFGLTTIAIILFVLGCGGGGGGGTARSGGGSTGGGGGSSTPQATTITLTTTNAKVAQYAPLTITATVTGDNPTGNVTFYNFGAPIGSGYAPSGSQFVFQGNPLTVGVYQFTASYSGDSKNLPCETATPLIQVITGNITAVLVGSTGADVHSIPATIGLQ